MSDTLEIERKFLAKERPDLVPLCETRILQGYLAKGVEEIRVRATSDAFYLTLKRGHGLVREEHEFQISLDTFHQLSRGVRFLTKNRVTYLLPDGNKAELDVFLGLGRDLQTVEVEFPSMDAAHAFVPPDWFGAEITGDRRYSNSQLIEEVTPWS